MRKRIVVVPAILITIILGSSLLASAQEQPPPRPALDGERPQMQPRPPRPPDDPMADDLFPPDMIMQHQRELALTSTQKTFMLDELQRTTTRYNELRWQLQDALDALHETTKNSRVNEQLALSQLSKVLDAEREIKTLHMGMHIRIKNQLTADQQMKLQTFRNNSNRPPDGQRRDRRPPGGPDGQGRPRPPDGDGLRPPGGPGLGGPGGQGGGGPRPPGGRPR